MTQNSKPGIEARKTPRRSFTRHVGVLYSGRYIVCKALQISEGGMLVLVAKTLQMPNQIVVTILVPGGGFAVARAEILYRQGVQGNLIPTGMRFVNLGLAFRRVIRNYVAAKTQKEAEEEDQFTDSPNREVEAERPLPEAKKEPDKKEKETFQRLQKVS